MKLKEFDIDLDIKKSTQVPLYEVVVGDYETNIYNIKLEDDGQPYPLEGLDVEIAFAKPDRTTVVQDSTTGVEIEDNIIKCTLNSNTIAVPGRVMAEVRVLQDVKVLTSSRFSFYVKQPILNDETVKSSNEYPMLVRALEDAKEAAEFLPEINAAVVDIRDAESDLNQSIRQASDLDDTLKGTIVSAGQSKDLLDGSIEDAGTAKTQLDGSISSAGTSKTELEGSITQAGTTKEQLDGSIAQAGTKKTELDGSITAAGQVKEALDESIVTGDLAAFRQEFTEHKNDYATYKDSNNLKVAMVEKELNDYKATMQQVNINQEPKQKATGYGVISLPPNAANGQVSGVVRGLTYTNLLGTHKTQNSVLVANVGSSIGLATNGGIISISSGFKKVKLIKDNKYLIKTDWLPNTDNNINVLRVVNGSVIEDWTVLGTPTISGLSTYLVFVAPDTDEVALVWRNNVAESNYHHDKTILVNLTELGEMETDVDKLIQKYRYIDGTKSTVSAMRLKSVGKNLFDKSKATLGYRINPVSGGTNAQAGYFATDFIEVQPGENYYRSIKETTALGDNYNFYDEDKVFVTSVMNPESYTNIITIPQGVKYIRMSGKLENLDIYSFTRGSTATPYEPYTESTQYLPNVGELRSLPNGVKDEVRVSGNKAEKVQRVKKYVLQASDVSLLHNAYTNLDYVVMKKPIDYIGYGNQSSLRGSMVFNNTHNVRVEDYGGTDSINMVGRFHNQSSPNEFYYGVVKGTYSTIEEAREQLVGLELTYQLAEPIVTPIQVSGTLLSNPSGTVYVEPVVADAGIYDEGMAVLHEDLPIKAIEKVSKVDFTTGLETELDIEGIEISTDGLSFTHPELEDGDIVFFTYFYDKEGTLGETTIEYYDSRYVLKDDVTGKFYKVVPKVSNGELINDLVEV